MFQNNINEMQTSANYTQHKPVYSSLPFNLFTKDISYYPQKSNDWCTLISRRNQNKKLAEVAMVMKKTH